MTSILEVYQTSRAFLEEKGIQQIVAMCGEGRLRVGSPASTQFRELLSHLPSASLKRYAEQCLAESFPDGGLALQDIVNEIGGRLGFIVEFGRYRGGGDAIGFDGIWCSATGHAVVVEVKTTDTYRINLDTLAEYRTRLALQHKLALEKSSILVVVGRQDTGDLEAQIRGSRHAWDIRVISIASLLQLLAVKESLAAGAALGQVGELLRPFEYTRLDRLVDLMFFTSAGVKAEEVEPEEVEPDEEDKEHVSRASPANFHEACVERVARSFGVGLVRDGRNRYVSSDKNTAVVCAVSKPYPARAGSNYWFAFHPTQREYLESHARSFLVLGLGSAGRILVLPLDTIVTILPDLSTTESADRMYWHIKLFDDGEHVQLLCKPPLTHRDVSLCLLRDPVV